MTPAPHAWRWINPQLLMLLHDESLEQHGGASGLRDAGLLESALARPQNLLIHGDPDADAAALAAACAFGLIRNHPFVDGNKRAAFLGIGLFLALNGLRLQATQVEATIAIIALAAGETDEPTFAAWLRAHIVPRAQKDKT